MKSFKLFALMAVLSAMTALTGCKPEKIEDPYIHILGEDTYEISQQKTTLTVTIESNRDWAVRFDEKSIDWMVVEPAKGTLSAEPVEVTLTVAENMGANRRAAIEFYTGTATAMLTVIQEGPEGDSDGVESKTVAEFIQAADKTTYYRLTGTVSGFSATYCSFNLTDESGTIYVYSVAESSKAEWSGKIKNGGTITLKGRYEYYAAKSQHEVVDAEIESFTGAGEAPAGNPEGTGTESSPFNVAAACQAVKNLTWTSTSDFQKVGPYYVKGKVSAISQDYTYNVSEGRTFGNARFSISDDGTTSSEQFTLYNLYYLGNQKYVAGQTDIKVGDDVIIYAELMNYRGDTPENSGGYLYSLNGDTGGNGGGGGQTSEAVTGTVTEIIALADNTAVEIPEATVAAMSTVGVVVTDGTSNVYIYFDSKAGETVPAVAIGDKVKVTATKATYGGVPELKTPTVTKLSAGTITYPAPKDLNAVAATYSSAVTEFVQMTGTLKVSGNYFNVEMDGVDASAKMGSVSSPLASLNVAGFDGKKVTVKGYFTGITGSGKYINVVATEVALADANAKYCTVTPTSISVKADATSATFEVKANADWTAVSDNAAFAVSPASGSGDATVTVTFGANEGEARTANVKVTCAEAGAEVTVVITQAKPSSGEALIVSVDFTAEIAELPQASANGKQDGTYTFGGYEFILHAADKFYQAKSNDMFYLLIGKKDSYVQLPAISGKALIKVKFLTGAGASENVILDVATADGARLNINDSKLKKGTEYEWEVNGTAGAAYRLVVTNAYNAQFQNLVLTYE